MLIGSQRGIEPLKKSAQKMDTPRFQLEANPKGARSEDVDTGARLIGLPKDSQQLEIIL